MCKLESFGNCDPETKDREYCIFHKPNKSEEEARLFWRKFLERYKPKRKKEFDEHLKLEVEKLIFSSELNCKEFVFPDFYGFGDIVFIFEENVDFENCTFEGYSYFDGSTFKKNANFRNATFKRPASFEFLL